VKAKLEDTRSPQQISAWLRTEYPDRPARHICHETIYRALYLGRKGIPLGGNEQFKIPPNTLTPTPRCRTSGSSTPSISTASGTATTIDAH
jgi:hypothetical protein